MFLAVNIGNTNIQMGLFSGKKLICCLVFPTFKKPKRNYYKAIRQNLSQFKNIEAIAICSVVPSLTKPFQKLFKKYLKIDPLIITEKLNLGIKLNYKKNQLGADRIANAVGAHYLYKKGCIVVDLGTAITFDVISSKGAYLGGAIAPGIDISSKALFSGTNLPEIKNLDNTKFAIGKNTSENLQIGILFGFSSMIEGILDKFKKELKSRIVRRAGARVKPRIVRRAGARALIILTGGDAALISKKTNFSHIVNPFITLEGIRIIYEKNKIKY